ncbi:MAG: hypothetical protein AAFX54_18140 [Pseudomonadota bacterium]
MRKHHNRKATRLNSISILYVCAGAFLLSACASPNDYGNGGIFSYSKDRCQGSYNQCRNDCNAIPNAMASASCFDRCLEAENRCYAVGDDGARSSLAQDSLIGQARTQEEKEADFRRWKRQRAEERDDSGDGASSIIEILPEDIEVKEELSDQ